MSKQAIEGTRVTAFMVDPDDVIVIGIDTDDGPDHPLWDERIKLPLDEGMVLNMLKVGVIQAIRVRKVRSTGAVEVVAGRRRVMHAREAKKRQKVNDEITIRVPAMLQRGDDNHIAGISESENALRVDDTPLMKARKVARLLDMGQTEEDIGTYFGVGIQTVNNWLKLTELDKSVQKAVEKGEISATAASRLASLDPEGQKSALKELRASGKKPTIKSTTTKVNNSTDNKGSKTEAPSKRALKKLVQAFRRYEDGFGEYDDWEKLDLDHNIIQGIRFAIGDLSAASIKGLTQALRDVQGN